MKRIVAAALLLIIFAGAAHASRLFDYRGIFPADRESNSRITNYILLKKDARIRFEVEEQGLGATDKVRVDKVELTSQTSVSFSDAAGIKTLNIPETGIYEITLAPASDQPGEIRFVLKVVETTDEVASETVPVAPTASTASAAVPAITTADITQAVIVNNPQPVVASEGVVFSGDQLPLTASAASAVVAPLTASPVVEINDSSDMPVLKAPAAGHFINPLSGFKFVGEGMNLIPEQERRQRIKIFNRLADNSLAETAGSFFSPEPDILMFLPEKILSGALYYIEVYDAAGNRRAEYRAFALPELSAEFKKVASDLLLINISWQSQPGLMPNPAGQMLALQNCDVTVYADAETLVNLTSEHTVQPFGSLNQVNWRARPYNLEIEIPVAGIASECRVEIMAAVDGSEQKAVASRASWQKAGEEDDFSDVEASDDLIYEKPKEEFSIASFTAREQLPETAGFAIEKSFILVDNEADSLVSWPQDVVWDENGSLWVLDSQLRRIANYNAAGMLRTSFGTRGDTPGTLGLPVALAQKGENLFVSDTSRHAVHKFNNEGLFVVSILSEPSSGVVIDLPGGICFRKDEMWVADRGTARILCFNQQGGFLGSFGSTAAAPIEAPVSIRADADSLYILEKSGLVKKFSPMGQFDATFQSGSSDGSGLEVDRWGGVWVCDAGKFRVARFSKKGAALTELKAPPAARPWLPTAVAVRSDGKVAVADAANKMLHIFTPVE